jgi:hypothetical protein
MILKDIMGEERSLGHKLRISDFGLRSELLRKLVSNPPIPPLLKGGEGGFSLLEPACR